MIHILILSLLFASYIGIDFLIDNFVFPGHNTRNIHTDQVKLLEAHTVVHGFVPYEPAKLFKTHTLIQEIVPNDTEGPAFLNPLNDAINQTFNTSAASSPEVPCLLPFNVFNQTFSGFEPALSPGVSFDHVSLANTSETSTTALAIFIPPKHNPARRYVICVFSFLLFVELLWAYHDYCRRQEQQPEYQEEEIIVNGRFRRIRREVNPIPREEKEEQMEGVILRRDMANGRPYWVRREENQIPREEKGEQGEGRIMLRVDIDGRPRWVSTNSFQSNQEARFAEERAWIDENGVAEQRPAIPEMVRARERARARRAQQQVAEERPADERPLCLNTKSFSQEEEQQEQEGAEEHDEELKA